MVSLFPPWLNKLYTKIAPMLEFLALRQFLFIGKSVLPFLPDDLTVKHRLGQHVPPVG